MIFVLPPVHTYLPHSADVLFFQIEIREVFVRIRSKITIEIHFKRNIKFDIAVKTEC